MKGRVFGAAVLAVVFAVGLSGSALGSTLTGGDATSQAEADAVLDIVFAIDTSGSMYDDITAIGTVAQSVVTNLDCPEGDIWVRARFMGITGTRDIFNETVRNYVLAIPQTPISNHSEDNGPAVTDLVNWYNWNDDTTAEQNYFKAVVSIGDEGTENGAGVYQSDWDAAYVANQAAIANDVMVFGWVTDDPTSASVVPLFGAMAEGGTGGGYTFGATGGILIDDSKGTGDIEGTLEEIICLAGSGGNDVVPEPGTFAIWGLGLLSMLGFGWFRRKRAA